MARDRDPVLRRLRGSPCWRPALPYALDGLALDPGSAGQPSTARWRVGKTSSSTSRATRIRRASRHSATAGWADKLQFARYVLRQSADRPDARQAWRLQVAGLLVSVASTARASRSSARLQRSWRAAILLAFLLGFDYDFLNVAVFRPYPLVVYGLLAMWAGSGAAWRARRRRPTRLAFTRGRRCTDSRCPSHSVQRTGRVNDRSR